LKNKTPRFFIYGYYGFGNVGDDLLLNTVVASTLKFVPEAQFVVHSLSPVKLDTKTAHVKYLPLAQITSDQRLSKHSRLARYVWNTWQSLADCTHLVFGGGTLFHASAKFPVNLALIFVLVVMAKLRGLDVYALGVGVAPLRRLLARLLMNGILALVTDFVVRDKTSLQHCHGLVRMKTIRTTADLVFSLPQQFVSRYRKTGQRPMLAITLAASDIGDGAAHEHFLYELASALKLLVTKGWSISFLAFQELDHSGVCVSDTALFKRVQSISSDLGEVVIRMSADYKEISNIYSAIDVVAGMRFHGHVLAAMQGIPFVGFGRDAKVKDLCADLSMPFLDLRVIDATLLATAIEGARETQLDAQRVRELVRRSSDNFSRILGSVA
jgi:polysaccharide pyruvyl transferase WcaK-like protein